MLKLKDKVFIAFLLYKSLIDSYFWLNRDGLKAIDLLVLNCWQTDCISILHGCLSVHRSPQSK